jgi:hypothetical protein
MLATPNFILMNTDPYTRRHIVKENESHYAPIETQKLKHYKAHFLFCASSLVDPKCG